MAGGSKPKQPKTETDSKTKDETQQDKEETEVESKPADEPKTNSSTNPQDKGKGKIGDEAKEPETEIAEKSGMKRKRESVVVKSSYSLRSGMKGSAVEVGKKVKAAKKVKGKKKEKETEDVDVVDEEGSCKRQSKRFKRNDDKDKDGDGSGVKSSLRARASNN